MSQEIPPSPSVPFIPSTEVTRIHEFLSMFMHPPIRCTTFFPDKKEIWGDLTRKFSAKFSPRRDTLDNWLKPFPLLPSPSPSRWDRPPSPKPKRFNVSDPRATINSFVSPWDYWRSVEGDQLIKDGMNVPIRLSDGEALRGIIRGECESFNVHRLPRFATVIESLVCKETITMSRLINGELRSSSKIRPRKLENGFESAPPGGAAIFRAIFLFSRFFFGL